MKTKGYALFLIPNGKAYEDLAKLIATLSKKYSAPNFIPHVTLLGFIMRSEDQVIEITRKLASKIKPFRIELFGIKYMDYYIQALFLKVKVTKEVLGANHKARQIFNIGPQEYTPHLSLIYGDFPESLKKEIIKEQKLENINYSFLVKTVCLFNTNGKIEDWKKIAEFKLSGIH